MTMTELTKADNGTSAVELFKKQLSGYEQTIVEIIKTHGVSPKEFMIHASAMVRKNEKLLECDRGSLFGSIFAASELGLIPNTEANLCYILPYNRKVKEGNQYKQKLEAQFQIGYLGILEIVYRNPEIESIDVEIRYEKDEFKETKGSTRQLVHVPAPDGKRGKPIGVYAIAFLRNSRFPKWTYLSEEQVMKFKEMSQGAASNYSPWNQKNDPELWMWKKTAIRQLFKSLPKTSAMHKALAIDQHTEMGASLHSTEDGTYEIVESEAQKEKKAELKNEVKSDKYSKAVKDQLFDKEKD